MVASIREDHEQNTTNTVAKLIIKVVIIMSTMVVIGKTHLTLIKGVVQREVIAHTSIQVSRTIAKAHSSIICSEVKAITLRDASSLKDSTRVMKVMVLVVTPMTGVAQVGQTTSVKVLLI